MLCAKCTGHSNRDGRHFCCCEKFFPGSWVGMLLAISNMLLVISERWFTTHVISSRSVLKATHSQPLPL